MDEATARQENCPQQQSKTVRFACDETERGGPSLSLGTLLSLDVSATSGPTEPEGHEQENAVEQSLQIVPYVPLGSGQVSTGVANHNNHPLFNLLSNSHRLPLPSSIPRHVLVSEAGPSRGVGSGGQELQLPVSPPVSASAAN